MNAKDAMLAELKARDPSRSLPQKFYTDPEFYRLDLELIFYRDWLFAGHDCEIPAAGDYFTMQVGDYPIIVVRGPDGSIGALHNSCRHRGSRICPAPRGEVKRFVCPYHQWMYDLDGSLIRARQVDGDVDKAQFGLKPVHCESVGGYIFVCVAPVAPNFEPFREQAERYLRRTGSPTPRSPSRARSSRTATGSSSGKTTASATTAPRTTRNCAGRFRRSPTLSGADDALDDPELKAHWDRCEAAGLPSGFQAFAELGNIARSRIPLLNDTVSYTMSGRAAVSVRLSDIVTEPRIGTLLLFHYPSTWNHVLGDHAVSFQVLPIGPTQTQVTTKWLVAQGRHRGQGLSIEDLTEVWLATNAQDQRVVEENQIGIRSPAYEPGPYAPEARKRRDAIRRLVLPDHAALARRRKIEHQSRRLNVVSPFRLRGEHCAPKRFSRVINRERTVH